MLDCYRTRLGSHLCTTPHAGWSVEILLYDKKMDIILCRDDPEIAQLLLASGADVNVVDFNGVTAIETASFFGHARVLETLCAVPSADPNTQASPQFFGVSS